MSEKRFDNYKRWRSKTVAFRMSPEEADELDVQVALSGLSKQDYLIQCCFKHEIKVVCGDVRLQDRYGCIWKQYLRSCSLWRKMQRLIRNY